MDNVPSGQSDLEPLVATDEIERCYDGDELAFSIYCDKHTAIGELAKGSWHELAALLTEHSMVDMAAARAAYPQLVGEDKKFRDTLKAGAAVTGTVIEGPRKAGRGRIICRSMYVLDIEEQGGHIPPSFKEICDRATARGYRFCIGSTFKSTKAGCYRMCFPLSAPLDIHKRPAADRAAALALAVELGLEKVVDRGKLHGWSLYFLPRAPQGEGETPPEASSSMTVPSSTRLTLTHWRSRNLS